ncbi:MAG: ribonuclease Y [bacterium]
MTPTLLAVIAIVVGALVGAAIGYFLSARAMAQRGELSEKKAEALLKDTQDRADKRAADLLAEARKDAEQITKKANDRASESVQRAKEGEQELRRRVKEFEKREELHIKAEQTLTEQLDKVDKRRTELDRRSANLDKREKTIESHEDQMRIETERIANMDQEQARREVLARIEDSARYESAKIRKELEDEARNEANEIARKLILKAVFRCAVDHYSDSLITTVEIKNDEMKGRIIGREGRNIRAIEAATGVDVIIDDTPNVIMLSSFDGVRREVARQAVERLIQDGRIHPAKIEEVVSDAQKAVDEEIWRAGQEATFKVGVTGVNPEMIKGLGKLKYRTSYGQNVLAHSIEVAIMSGVIAAELGIPVKNAKRGGLFHDIGKGAGPEMEGSHTEVGGIMGRKYGENSVVINCIEGHHGDVEMTIEACVVQVADAISAVRPGARGEALTSYIQRLRQLEDMAMSFAGVEKVFAISAGRELRVMVKPEMMDDILTYDLSRQIAKRIEEEMEYPGTVKVTVIRETRETATAR